MEDIKELLTLPVNADFLSNDSVASLGELKLGMPTSEFLEKYVKRDYLRDKTLGAYLSFPKTVIYTYFKSIEFCFDISTGLLDEIYLKDDFSGKYGEAIGIGNTIQDLRAYHPDLLYDDQYVSFDRQGRILFVADDDVTSLENEADIDKCKIEAIRLRL